MKKVTARPEEIVIMPKIDIEDIEDAYAFYVLCLGVSEDVFWNYDINFVNKVIENKLAFEAWQNSPKKR